MELQVRFEPAANLRVQILSGDVNGEELRAAITELYETPDVHPNQRSIWDLRDAKFESMSSDDVRAIARLVRGSWTGGGAPKLALVVSDDLAFGLSRMYETLVDDCGETCVFRDMTEAMSWIGLEVP